VIAVDSSALIAILLDKPAAKACRETLAEDMEPVISAAVLAESMIVARGRNVLPRLDALLTAIPLTVVSVDENTAARVSSIYMRWGKRYHPARLNYCDCFSYDLAKQFGCPLLFIGNDFSQTDISNALA